jgi:uncharacterized DUF497 family protein
VVARGTAAQYFPEQEFPPGFEWDPVKNQTNLEKHSISFYEAVRVFDDPLIRVEVSPKPEHGEKRFVCIGVRGDQLITVVATNRGDRTRIISARNASNDEARRYRASSTTG